MSRQTAPSVSRCEFWPLTRPNAQLGGGTSLHDVPGWFNRSDFHIPEGTEYSDEIVIKRDRGPKPHPRKPGVEGWHYQLEPKTRMTLETFKGYLDHMARAAVARQVELARAQVSAAGTQRNA